MKRDRFHSMDFDEATLLKLRIFEGYAQDWIDTLANPKSAWGEIHIYDFFAGSGRDAAGNEGTPVLLFRALREALSRDGWEKVQAHLHLFDAKASKVEQLKRHIEGVAAEQRFRDRALKDELDVLELCFQHGVAPKKCETVIRNLRKEGVLAMRWRLPTAKGMGGSRGRPVKYT